jgi:RNA recognition motif-containing protein
LRTIFLSRLPYETTINSLDEMLADFKPRAMYLCHHAEDHAIYPNRFKGCALVQFYTERDSDRAIEHFDGMLAGKLRLQAKPAQSELFVATRNMKPERYRRMPEMMHSAV